jgi:hypothetical protein
LKGYFLVVDILGFGQMVNNLSPSDLDEKMNTWIDIVKGTCESLEIENYQLISDTLFIGVGNENSDLSQLAMASRELLNSCVCKSIPIRGAISSGDYIWSKELVYGKAVIDAHELEMNQDWVGISCIVGTRIPDTCENLICYSIPFKKGPSRVLAAVVWDVPYYEDLISYLSSGGLTNSDHVLTADWFARIEKTILFSMYIKLSNKLGFPRDYFGGFSPLHSISKYFESTL